MKNILVRTAVVALFAAGSLAAVSAEPTPRPTALSATPAPSPATPIPVCWQCGRSGK